MLQQIATIYSLNKEDILPQKRFWTNCFHVNSGLHTHPNSNVDVLSINLSPQVFADLLLAQELFQELGAVFQIVAADPPLPRFPMLDAGGFVTRAPLHSAWAARFGERVSQSSRRHRQQKRSLLERCDKGRMRTE